MLQDDQVQELKKLCSEVLVYEDGGNAFILLHQLQLPNHCTPTVVDALLCPTPRDGYTSRLFFAQQIQCDKTLNWNVREERILERTWHAFSWRIPYENLRLLQMVADHISGFR